MFSLEKEMTPVVTGNWKTISDSIQVLDQTLPVALALELPVKYRLIDVAIAYALPGEVCRVPTSFKYMSSITMDILSMFYIYPLVTRQRLKRELFLGEDEVEKQVRKLEKQGFIERVSRFSYRATEFQEVGEVGIISIELKLCDWREALQQAEYNLLFSDYSFVALDRDRLNKTEELLAWFREKNVGLIAVGRDGGIDSLVVPGKNLKFDRRLYLTQRIKLMQDLVLNQKWRSINEESY